MTTLDLYNDDRSALPAMRFVRAQGKYPDAASELMPRVEIEFPCVLKPAHSKDAPCARIDSRMP
jgi:hypothetical protein